MWWLKIDTILPKFCTGGHLFNSFVLNDPYFVSYIRCSKNFEVVLKTCFLTFKNKISKRNIQFKTKVFLGYVFIVYVFISDDF